MGNKGFILGATGQALDDQVKRKIESAVKIAVEYYDVTDFYFIGADGYDDALDADNITAEHIGNKEKNVIDYVEINKYIVDKIKEYRRVRKDRPLNTSLLVARTADAEYDQQAFEAAVRDCLIDGCLTEDEKPYDGYTLRDEFFERNEFFVFLISNPILVCESAIKPSGLSSDKIIIIE